jgi:hypothetical protein
MGRQAGTHALLEKTMQNVGSLDRIIRIVLGVALLAIVFVGPETRWGWLGLIPLLTGVVGFCPLYRMLHLDTNRSAGGTERPV